MAKRKVSKVKKAQKKPAPASGQTHKKQFDQLLDDAIFGVKKK